MTDTSFVIFAQAADGSVSAVPQTAAYDAAETTAAPESAYDLVDNPTSTSQVTAIPYSVAEPAPPPQPPQSVFMFLPLIILFGLIGLLVAGTVCVVVALGRRKH